MSFGYDIGRAYAQAIVFIAVLAFIFGGLCVWLIPKLWHWLKPIIHQVTA